MVQGGGRDKRRIHAVCAAESAEIQHERVGVIEVEMKKSVRFERMKESVNRGWLIKSDDE